MSVGLPVAAMLHTFFVIAFLVALMPFRVPERKFLPLIIGIMVALCVTVGVLAIRFGADFLGEHGYLIIGIPLFIMTYLFSKAKGSRFAFVILTVVIFHRIISSLLIVVRVYSGGFTGVYFLINFLLFGAMVYGGWRMRADFHKIVFAYQKEFGCLSVFLFLLLTLVWLFTPVISRNEIDSDILMIAAILYLMTIMLYLYIGVSFHSFSKRLDAERNALSLGHQMQAAQEHIKLMRATQENTKLYRHDLRHHLSLIGEFLDHENLTALREYLIKVRIDIDAMIPEQYCMNEPVNLICAAFAVQAQKLGILLKIDVQIPQTLPISDTELCTLFSNALENAIAATARVEDEREKSIELTAAMSDGKLLLSVENPYSGTVCIKDGLPQSECKGHGFGTKSIEAIVEKYGGLSSFEAQDGVFTVRLIV